MAFAFPEGFPFAGETCFARSSSRQGGSCRASAFAQACAGGRPGPSRRRWTGPHFGDGAAREFEVVETPESYLIYFDASGFPRENVKLSVSEGGLLLSAEKDGERSVAKTWALPNNVLEAGISAKLDNDELVIVLPKIQEAPKASFNVTIEGGSGAAQRDATTGTPHTAPVQPAGPSDTGAQTEPRADQEDDGSWVEVADEDVTRAREKSKAAPESSVLEDAAHQQSDSP